MVLAAAAAAVLPLLAPAGEVTLSASAPAPAPPQLGPNLVTNGDFSAGTTGWLEFATPNQSFMVSTTSGGVYQFFRQPPPAGTSNQATLFQETGAAVPAHTALTAQFDLGNSSSVRKRISTLVLNFDFSDLSVCTFFLEPNTPLRTYQMRTHSTRPWTNAAIYFFAATTGSNGGFYTIDNVSLRQDGSASAIQTTCHDPSVPPGIPGGGGVPPPSLLGNGDFGTGALAPWGLFGQIVGQIVNGVFEFHRPPGTPSGTILQPTGVALPARELIVASFQLGNSSTVRKRVTVILHDADFSDLSACTFFLAPGQPLADYGMRSYTTKAWTSATFSLFPATIGLEASIRLDNVTLRQSTATGATGTECVEPFVPLAIALSPATVGIPTQAQGTLTASISAPAGGAGVTINLLSSDPNAATVPASILIPAGAMQAPVTVTAGTGTGGATITASATGLASATATVTTALRTMTLDVTNPNLTIGNPVNGTVTLAQPAPAGGVSVTLVSSDPNVSVTSPVAIGPGATSGSFVVTANAAVANATITASAPGFANATLNLTAGFRIWIANASGFWDDAVNWKDGIVPANGDSVLIDRPAAITVTVRVPTAAIATLQANENLSVQSTLTANGQAFFDGGMSLSGTLTGSGTVNLRSPGAWTNGTLSVASLIVAGGSTLTISGATSHLMQNGSLQNDGTVAWTGGNLTLTDSTLQNNATLQSSANGGGLFIGTNSNVINASGAIWDASNQAFTSTGTGTHTFTNAGLFRGSPGFGNLGITGAVAFSNTGTLEIQTGSFSNTVPSGWTSSGGLIVATGATLNLGGATLQAGTTTGGGGTLVFGGTTVSADLTVTVASTLSGNLTGPGKLVLNAGMTWSAVNTTIANSGLTIPAGQTLTLLSTGIQTLSNSPLVNHGTIAWPVGGGLTITNGSFQNTGTLDGSIAGGPLALNDSSLQNTGTVLTSGSMSLSGASSIVNAAGATWDFRAGSMGAGAAGTKTFTNAGLLKRSGSGGTVIIGSPIAVTNTGTIDIQTGGLRIQAPWTTTGPLLVSAGATLELVNATVQTGTTINGAGALVLGATTLIPDFTLTQAMTLSGNLTGPGKLVLNAGMTWSAVNTTIANSGLTIPAGQTLTLQSTGIQTLSNSPLVNHGTIAWPVGGGLTITNGSFQNTGTLDGIAGGPLALNDSSIQNTGTVVTNGSVSLSGASSVLNAVGATWDLRGSMGAGAAGPKTFTNAGLLKRSGSGGTVIIGSPIAVTNTGTIDVQTGGLRIQAPWTTTGPLLVSAGATLELVNATVQTGTTINGAGALVLGATTLIPDFTLTQAMTLSGNLTGPGKLVLNAGMTWSAVNTTIANSGLTIPAGQTLTLLSTGIQTLSNSPLVNHGTIAWPVGGGLTITNGSFQNTGTLNGSIAGGPLALNDSTFVNTGLVQLSGSLSLSGVSSVENAVGSTWERVAGNIGVGGAGAKSFTNAGTFRNTGAIGTFTVAPSISFVNSGIVEVRLGGTSAGTFDVMSIGSTTLGGTLDVKLANGFVPSPNDSFAIATYTSLTGSFATILGNGHTFTPTYGATTLTIQKQ